MEGETDEQGIIPESQPEAPTSAKEANDHQEAQHEADRGAGDGEETVSVAAEDLSDGVADVVLQETLTVPEIHVEAEDLPPTEEVMTPSSASSLSPLTQDCLSEPCFYCLRSLDSFQAEASKQMEDLDPSSLLPSSGQKVNYQTDPRPHFGVAWSSHSTCSPLWGSEGPCWGQRTQEVTDQIDPCPHCHLGLPPDTLRWHEAKCLLFEGLGSPKK